MPCGVRNYCGADGTQVAPAENSKGPTLHEALNPKPQSHKGWESCPGLILHCPALTWRGGLQTLICACPVLLRVSTRKTSYFSSLHTIRKGSNPTTGITPPSPNLPFVEKGKNKPYTPNTPLPKNYKSSFSGRASADAGRAWSASERLHALHVRGLKAC